MSAITTHVLDAVRGKPAAGIPVSLDHKTHAGWIRIQDSCTDQDGRCRDLQNQGNKGMYRLTFDLREYFASQHRISIYPEAILSFETDGTRHYHLPLLLSDNSYTTYRGS